MSKVNKFLNLNNRFKHSFYVLNTKFTYILTIKYCYYN